MTILGVGNVLLRDEGFGVHFVRYLAERYRLPEGVRIVDGGTLSYALLDTVCGCRHLIVVDVIKSQDEPGAIYRFTREELETRMPPATSAHEVTFPDVLFKAELMDELPQTVILCIVPGDYSDLGTELTPVLQDRIPVMEELLLRELSEMGIKLRRR